MEWAAGGVLYRLKTMFEQKFTLEQAKEYVRQQGKKALVFYWNVFGWDTYLTLEPTFATPTGILKSFPRTKRVWA